MLQTQVTLPTTITTTTTTTTATTLIDSFHAHHGVCWLHHKLNISEHISGYLLKKLSNHITCNVLCASAFFFGGGGAANANQPAMPLQLLQL
jgi:hypothetical protein